MNIFLDFLNWNGWIHNKMDITQSVLYRHLPGVKDDQDNRFIN